MSSVGEDLRECAVGKIRESEPIRAESSRDELQMTWIRAEGPIDLSGQRDLFGEGSRRRVGGRERARGRQGQRGMAARGCVTN